MRNFIFLFIFLVLSNCATPIEPSTQKNNPAKVDENVKIIYADPDEIYIMYYKNPLKFTFSVYPGFEYPKSDMILTAQKHCSSYRKNGYLLKKYRNYNKATEYDYRKIIYKGKNYVGYRFICATKPSELVDRTRILSPDIKVTSSVKAYNNYYYRMFDYISGPLEYVELQRSLTKAEIAENKRKEIENQKRIAELEKQRKMDSIKELEPKFQALCLKNSNNNKFLKGTEEYANCLIDEDQKATAKKIEADKELKRKKVELEKKLAAMSPTERHAYNYSETFKFKKGTEQFNNCIFELYKAELDIQKLELEKQVAEANAKAAQSEKARADAVARAQIAAANASARASNLNNTLQLMELSNRLILGPPRPTPPPRLQTTCSYNGWFLNCF